MQATEKRKEDLSAVGADRKQRDLAGEQERQELQSFEQRIPNKKKLQELAEERATEGAAERSAKELHGKMPLEGNLVDDLNQKRQFMADTTEKCAGEQPQMLKSDPSADSDKSSADLNNSDMDYVIDEIPENDPEPESNVAPIAAPAEMCGIGIMIAHNTAGHYVVVTMVPTVCAHSLYCIIQFLRITKSVVYFLSTYLFSAAADSEHTTGPSCQERFA